MTVWESYCHALEKEGLISVSSPKFCAVYQKFLSRQQDKISCRVRFLKALLSIIHIHRVEENLWRCGIGTLGSSFHERWFFFRILCSCSRTLARICVVAFVLDHVRRIRNWTTVCGSYAKIGEECVTPSLPPLYLYPSQLSNDVIDERQLHCHDCQIFQFSCKTISTFWTYTNVVQTTHRWTLKSAFPIIASSVSGEGGGGLRDDDGARWECRVPREWRCKVPKSQQ